MIVQEPPYELVGIFADADSKAFFEKLIERGQERGCLARFRWRSVREFMRDGLVAKPADVVDAHVAGSDANVLLVWDHIGSGQETENPGDVESSVLTKIVRGGLTAERVLAVALEPEVEALLTPVWGRVKEILAEYRQMETPSDAHVLAEASRRVGPRSMRVDDPEIALVKHPKEMLLGLLGCVNLRQSSTIFGRIGERVSIPDIKRHAQVRRISLMLESWFPALADSGKGVASL